MSETTREKGDYFERLIKRVLKISPWYADQFSDVWLWHEWPDRKGRTDAGIDIVARRADSGELVGIQCKFYEPGHYLDKGQIDSFFAALSHRDFAEGMVFSTTDNWSKQAELLLDEPTKPVNRVRVQDLRDSGIDWSTFVVEDPEKTMRTTGRKHLRKHQREAVDDVINGFMTNDRGQMIMACGTGKTFTSLKLVEEMVPEGGTVLFLVPSISLLQQTLTEWKRETERHMRCYAVCSDVSVGKKQDDTNEIRPYDLVIPATTDPYRLSQGLSHFPAKDLTVVFSTYQSISKVSQAQKHSGSQLGEFDLVICDEAHRTTGVAMTGESPSEFMKIHDDDVVRAKHRLYMTATPRIYDDQSQKKAEENDYLVASMDNVETYGPEFHRLGFGKAVERDLLADYKVLILTVSESMLQSSLDLDSAANKEISLDDAVKIIGCWNGLAKRDNPLDETNEFAEDPEPMRRAVAFSRSIKDSKHITNYFPQVANQFIDAIDEPLSTRVEVNHVDGKDSVLHRSNMLDWLKEGAPEDDNTCRILSNARVLSEGVDVPALDAVLFLNPRDSVVDVVQSVGRVMRKSEGKKYGYIILPIAIPTGQSPEEALNDNKNYKVIWQVLQALRAHDERFNVMVNKLGLNKKRPDPIQIIGVGGGAQDRGDDGEAGADAEDVSQVQLNLQFYEQWREAIYAKIVDKVGDRRYWDTWAKDIADIAEKHIARMQKLLEDRESAQSKAFDHFLGRLHEEINPAVSRDDAIEMLAQHLITRPVFEALFANESFALNNPVSQAMQVMLDALHENTLDEERTTLEKFYRSVKQRAQGIDNAEGRQKVVIELYDKFFRNAFPKMADRLGIVYTPVEVVDYLLHSADWVLKQHFGKGLTDEGVHVLDPFTGTGTFITRLLQSGLIRPEDAERKFTSELHANELVLLAYYIAAVNIEVVYQEAFGGEYRPFEGIVWTDTFQMSENEQVSETDDGAQFKIMDLAQSVNSERVRKQFHTDIRVIVGNPPYSVGQESANDNNQNLSYQQLDSKIAATYAAKSSATLKRNLYDSYIRAIRWASDRIGDNGVISFVTNASFIDSNSMDGLRASLTDEFSAIWVFNARGNQRTSGETSRKEGGKIFGSGSRAPIALTVFVKDPNHIGACKLQYHDIGDYLTREEKLALIQHVGSAEGVDWQQVTPNKQHDWINQRDPAFEKFPAIDARWNGSRAFFDSNGLGISTNRDAWVYGFSRESLSDNVSRMIDFYNDEIVAADARDFSQPVVAERFSNSSQKIKWSASLLAAARKGKRLQFKTESITQAMYRPFTKQWLYRDRDLIERISQIPALYPAEQFDNRTISVTGRGSTKMFSALMTAITPDLELISKGQVFPLYWYQAASGPVDSIPGQSSYLSLANNQDHLIRHDGINDFMLEQYQDAFDNPSITKEDIFYYVYGVLHSPEYRERFGSDLKKMLPRIPFTEDFWAFSNAGRELGDLHVGYESVDPWPVTETQTRIPVGSEDDETLYRVEKMKWAGSARNPAKSVIIYNDFFTLSDIPMEAYDYIVNGKSALEWIMERYAITQDKASKIVNDPNEWSDDPRYVIDLVKRIVRVSMETNRIVASLPALNERDVEIKPTAMAISGDGR